MNEQDNNMMDTSTLLNHSIDTINRFEMFQILMRNAIEGVCSGVSEENYVKLFGGLSALKKSKSAPMKMNKTLKTKLLESLNSTVEQMVHEENMKDKFDILEKLVDECALHEGTKTWRPNGKVEDHVRSHVMDKKFKYKYALEEYVREKEHSTEMLKQKVSDLRAEICEAEVALHQISDICLDTSTIYVKDKNILNIAVNFK